MSDRNCSGENRINGLSKGDISKAEICKEIFEKLIIF